MRILIAALIAAFFMSSPALADKCGAGTGPVETLIGFLNQRNITSSFEVPEPNASAVTAMINDMEPKTDWKADRVVVYYDSRAALLVLHIGDCFSSPGPMPHSAVEGILREAAKGQS